VELLEKLPLKGKKILITAGPTYEAIDPVRFIGNHSSGKMGFDIANEAVNKGAEVILVTGPTHLNVQNSAIKLIRVISAQEMYDACHEFYNSVDVAIAAAAVADYRPKNVAEQKIKKNEATFSIELEKTKDILASLGEQKEKRADNRAAAKAAEKQSAGDESDHSVNTGAVVSPVENGIVSPARGASSGTGAGSDRTAEDYRNRLGEIENTIQNLENSGSANTTDAMREAVAYEYRL
jgi:phosphopantothenoylcysteine synthetase/decarboxylase